MADAPPEVLHVEPVADVSPIAVHGQAILVEGVEDHERDHLLRVLVRPVVVGSPADHRLQSVGVEIAGHQQVGSGLGGAVGTGGLQRRLLGERPSLDRPVDLVGGHLEVAQATLPGRVEEHVRALHVGHDERLGTGDRPIHVRLGGKVDDRVAVGDRVGHRRGVLDRPVHEPDLVDHVVQVLAPPGVGQLVQHGYLVAVLTEAQANERRADEPGAATYQQPHRDPTVLDMNASSPSVQLGSRGISAARSVPRTL